MRSRRKTLLLLVPLIPSLFLGAAVVRTQGLASERSQLRFRRLRMIRTGILRFRIA